MKIYVGNLSFGTTKDDLKALFEQYGTVEEVTVIYDRMTGKSRGFAFITMPDEEEAQNAVENLNGSPFDSRSLTVNFARPRKDS